MVHPSPNQAVPGGGIESIEYRKKGKGKKRNRIRRGEREEKMEGGSWRQREGRDQGTPRKTEMLSNNFALGITWCCMAFVSDPVRPYKDPLC